jgi:S-adenosylmethionine-diacylgycerolhomoserine-N-methlytransferase
MQETITATESMNRMYRYQRHVYDVTRSRYLLGRDALIADLRPAADDHVLEIGCGTGRNLIRAAQRYRDVRFFGIDVSTEMLTTAITEIEKAGLASRIRVAHANAAAFDPAHLFGRARFERVFLSYTLSMIPAWRQVLVHALDNLTPGGELHVVDFGRMEALPRFVRAALLRWLAAFDVTPRVAMEACLRSLAHDLDTPLAFRHRNRGYVQQAMLRLPGHAAQ